MKKNQGPPQARIILIEVLQKIWSSFKDLLPIILVIAFFQIVVLRQPLPNIGDVVFGGVLVVLGLTLFIQGLEMGLFPIGENMAHALARKGSLFWLLTLLLHWALPLQWPSRRSLRWPPKLPA